jgi:hypothetical protein
LLDTCHALPDPGELAARQPDSSGGTPERRGNKLAWTLNPAACELALDVIDVPADDTIARKGGPVTTRS